MLHTFIQNLAHSLPLEIFVCLGSFLEEVIAPIPSPSIMMIAGSFGAVQGYTYHGLAILVLLASIGKTLGGLTMYMLARTARGPVLRFIGRFIRITEDDLSSFGKRFNGSWHDYGVYIFFRALPIIPSIVLSFGSGAIGIPVRLFVIGTFIGTLIRDTFYIAVGYSGTEYMRALLIHSSTLETYGTYAVVFFGIVGVFVYFYRRSAQTTVDT